MALGTHTVGPRATELIAGFVVGRHLESTVAETARAMHPHPTLSEAIGEAALAALGDALHIWAEAPEPRARDIGSSP